MFSLVLPEAIFDVTIEGLLRADCCVLEDEVYLDVAVICLAGFRAETMLLVSVV